MDSNESKKENTPRPAADVNIDASVPTAPANSEHSQSTAKRTKKEVILEELKEVAAIVAYLACSLCILETYKSLILLQLGMHEFVHNYEFAIVEALLLGKIVAVAQKLPLLSAFEDKPLAWLILFRSCVMTVIADLGGMVEDHIFPHSAHMIAQSGNPLALGITHQLASMLIFIVLFAVRGADNRLGPGTLRRMFFEAPVAKDS
jgi:hypothetical protein